MSNGFAELKATVRADPEYAWALHCNIAVPIMDSIRVSHDLANAASAHVMQTLFDYDITTHPNYEGKKSGAQVYHQMRVEAERAEDASHDRP